MKQCQIRRVPCIVRGMDRRVNFGREERRSGSRA